MFIEVQKTRGRNHENVLLLLLLFFFVQGALITQASHEECPRSMTKIFRARCLSGRPERVLFQAAQTSGFPTTLCKLNFFINRQVSLSLACSVRRRCRFVKFKNHQNRGFTYTIRSLTHPIRSKKLFSCSLCFAFAPSAVRLFHEFIFKRKMILWSVYSTVSRLFSFHSKMLLRTPARAPDETMKKILVYIFNTCCC